MSLVPISRPTRRSMRPIMQGGGGGGGGGGGSGTFVQRETDPPAIQYWVDPAGGSDGNDGSSPGNAWATFAHAIDQVGGLSGERVIGVVDGDYSGHVESNNVALFRNGLNRSASEMLWIRANNERAGIFRWPSGGFGFSSLINCSGIAYWGLVGIGSGGGTKAARAIFEASNCEGAIEYYRMLGAESANDQYTYRTDQSENGEHYYEECESWESTGTAQNAHGFSNHRSDGAVYRRCYENHRGAGSGTSFIEYRSNNTIFDNCISENGGKFTNIAEDFGSNIGLTARWGLQVGCIWLGFVQWERTFRNGNGSHDGARAYDCLLIDSSEDSIRSESNVGHHRKFTIYSGGSNGGRYGIRPRKFHTGSRVELVSSAILNGHNGAYGEWDEGSAWAITRILDYCNLYGNNGLDTWDGGLTTQQNVLMPREVVDADLVANLFTNSMSVDPFVGQYGMGAGQTLIWVPPGHPQAGAGLGGENIGCDILYRERSYHDPVTGNPVRNRSTDPLWNPSTGEFPFGAEVAGVNDSGDRLSNLHDRLGINEDTLPVGYGA